jgi:outer membrane murein-binding lipoprotein Lpp
MGLGNTAKKLQRVADMAETLYQKIDELRSQVNEVREHVEATSQRVERIERDLDDQRAVLDALAREQGIDVDAAAASAAIEEAEPGKTVADAEATDGTTDDAPSADDTATAE